MNAKTSAFHLSTMKQEHQSRPLYATVSPRRRSSSKIIHCGRYDYISSMRLAITSPLDSSEEATIWNQCWSAYVHQSGESANRCHSVTPRLCILLIGDRCTSTRSGSTLHFDEREYLQNSRMSGISHGL